MIFLQITLRPVRSDVPACDALIPSFAMRPSATEVSSALIPREPATGAAYLKDSPSIETFVFALVLAAARISAKCPESFADRPNAENFVLLPISRALALRSSNSSPVGQALDPVCHSLCASFPSSCAFTVSLQFFSCNSGYFAYNMK